MRAVLCEVRVREFEHLDDARVGDSVVDGAVLPARLDEPAPAQAGEVVRHLRLRQAEPVEIAISIHPGDRFSYSMTLASTAR